MLEGLIIAIPVVTAIVLIVGTRALRKPRRSAPEKTGDEANRSNPNRAALPFNRCQLARVRHVTGGDNVIAVTSTQEIRIRLGAIDCPENGQHWGDIATLDLSKMIGGRQIAFEGHGIDRFGRTIATIYVRDAGNDGWTDVNARMVMRGHAWVTRRHFRYLPHKRKAELNRLERWAQRKGVGLWKSHYPVPPWQRRARSGRHSEQ
jgi:endonuclease YncB( thermonuclease family)